MCLRLDKTKNMLEILSRDICHLAALAFRLDDADGGGSHGPRFVGKDFP